MYVINMSFYGDALSIEVDEIKPFPFHSLLGNSPSSYETCSENYFFTCLLT